MGQPLWEGPCRHDPAGSWTEHFRPPELPQVALSGDPVGGAPRFRLDCRSVTDTAALVRAHYSRQDLIGSILTALQEVGKNPDALTREDLATFEEFHLRGRDATREVAELAGFQPGMDVLDVGAGIGGPARTLAAEYGCRVHGIDLVEEYVEAAKELTKRVGMDDRVQFSVADALRIPFPDSRFDATFMEHVSMNIADKPALFSEIRRVLKPRGIFADYVICAGSETPVEYPVP